MFGLSPQELLIIALIVVLLFGAKKVPEFFSSLGKGIKEFKKAMHEEEPQDTTKEPQQSKAE